MNSYPGVCVCVCAMLFPPPPVACLPVPSVCAMCVSQPPVEGRPPLPIRDVHRDWQFRRHDLRGQHQRPELLRGRGPELGRRRRGRWLWLSGWGQTERQKRWCEASQEACWKDAQVAPMDCGSRFCRVVTRWRERRCGCCVEKKKSTLFEIGRKKGRKLWKMKV